MTNYFRELHPWTAAIYLFLVLILLMTAEYSPQMIGMFCLLSVNHIAIMGIKKYGKSLKGYLGIIVALAVFNVIFNPKGDTPFLYINDRPLTIDSLLYGVYMGFMVSALFLWFQIFQDIFDNRRITYLIGSRFPVCGLIISMVFCYYEKFMKKIDKIQEVWNTYGTEETFGKVKNAGIILSVLLSVMLEDSMDTAMSMSARGYGGKKRTNYAKYAFGAVDIILLVLSVGMAAVLICYKSALYPIAAMPVFYVIFTLIPVGYNIYKELQWKYYLSKI